MLRAVTRGHRLRSVVVAVFLGPLSQLLRSVIQTICWRAASPTTVLKSKKKHVSSEHKTNVNHFENRYKIHVYRQSSQTYFISLTLRSLISTSLAFGIFKLSSVWHLVCLIFLKDFKFYFRFKRGAFYFIMTTFRG